MPPLMVMIMVTMIKIMLTTMMMMSIITTRHEVPVSGEQIEVISMDDDLVVVREIYFTISYYMHFSVHCTSI